MAFDFSKIKPTKKETLPVDPIELFQRLTVSDPSINDLWLAQGDVLREWHKHRKKGDVGVVLNTGAGKTLVGLIMAQSLVNETKGKVLYACSSIQLVEQTAEKAQGYGLDVTTYFRRGYSNDLFRRCISPCITTYQAVFNGRSTFFKEDIAAIIFDDSHAAEHILRDHFSLRIPRDSLSSTYSAIVDLFRPYYEQVGRAGSYEELDDPDCHQLFLVPPFEIHRVHAELQRLLSSAPLAENPETTFAWAYLQDRVDLCCVLITGTELTITPAFVPVLSLPYFTNEIRRVYLSATLSAPDSFARTFGRVPEVLIAPSTTAGECERLILIPSKIRSTEEDTEIASQMIKRLKALILVPTYARATKWQKIATPPPRDKVSDHVRGFKTTSSNVKLLLAARYDGVDLPGDTCRVMVVDDLPIGVGPLERFLWEHLSLSNTLRTAVACRIVQSFGRISRGMTDHGVVILTGKRLVDWVVVPRNAATLPVFLQKQIALGYEVSTQAAAVSDLSAATDQCLNRDKSWLKAYNEYMQSAEAEEFKEDTERLTKVARAWSMFAVFFWERDYQRAAKCLQETLVDAFEVSDNTGAWQLLWLGSALEMCDELEPAREMYCRAHGVQPNIPAYPFETKKIGGFQIPRQIEEIARQFGISSSGHISLPKTFHSDLTYLNGTGSSAQTEEALRALGQYLGLVSTRPEKEFGTGPDVLWTNGDLPALCMEVKSDKTSAAYQKKEVGQLYDHVQWVTDNTSVKSVIPIFVGPILAPTKTANPPKDFLVATLDEFQSLAGQLAAALNDATNQALPLTLNPTLLKVFEERRLMWPDFFQTIKTTRLRDVM